ncbi:alcohol dehydrogenase [Aspergillus ellipticus CBS 707.79]|uniref:Alcohol dehydrogenase n=1 Tax=Aspergillus ellipticus CBS 707.79 TaxID=1448320 RepID=A0A319DBQ9_9EURO|nr:alcohol dehydrogenase [Aspergillus ellipticus CBS 707.79]
MTTQSTFGVGHQPLQGKVALVTGGATGFGKAIVEKLLSQGANVLVMDIRYSSAEYARNDSSTDPIYIQGDVSCENDWKRALQQALTAFGRLDIVVNNAGVLHKAQPSIELSGDEWERLFRVNVKGIHYSTKTIIPYFIEAEISGIFVNISSISGARPRPGLVWYGATKGAVNTATKGLAVEWAKQNIRFNAVCPSVGETAMMPLFLGHDSSPEAREKMLSTIPLGRVCQPVDVANAVSFLVNDDASYMTGVCLEVDGGRGI